MTDLSFAALGIAEPILRALAAENYINPTPIQARAIPTLLSGRDLLGIAQTGTGKTAAFGLPLLQKLSVRHVPPRPREAKALILAPTRELALQIDESLKTYGRFLNLRRAVILGGVGQNPQIAAMKNGVDILVATPGRLLDLVQQKHVRLDAVSVLVVDEADRMLDMGFIRDVRKIVNYLPKERQSMLFSATMPDDIARLVAEMMRNPERVEVAPQGRTADRVEQFLYHVPMAQKRDLLRRLLADNALSRVIVFTRTKHGANKVSEQLCKHGIEALAIHGNKSQNARQRALETFRSGKTRVLVATDIAARGIDIDDISHVVNFELPNEPESYVHRIGRTARAGGAGIAISLCDPSEKPYLRDIERLIRLPITVRTHDLPPLPEGEAKPQIAHPHRHGQKPFKPKRNGSRPHWRRNKDKKRDAA
ncbi:MAG TPA: DEAD/DEAH box helicase [Rhizomicrobium sp.]|nr:DEAD/DEAH box helicase [Rhizomicrobium sp.]